MKKESQVALKIIDFRDSDLNTQRKQKYKISKMLENFHEIKQNKELNK